MSRLYRAGLVAVSLMVLFSAPAAGVQADTAAGQCRRWRVVPTPVPPVDYSAALFGISGTSSLDVWTVGYFGPYPSPPIILHWDGTRWTPFWFPPRQGREPLDVVAISPSDVWVVGQFILPSAIRPLVMHWDGAAWRTMPVPVPEDYAYLNAVDALSSDDVWTVGLYDDAEGIHPLTLHWDGTAWRRVPAPNGSPLANVLFDVSPVAPNDVWAVGHQQKPGTFHFTSLIEHWDGLRWSLVPADPVPGGDLDDDDLYGVAATSPTDAWAVGSISNDAGLNAMLQYWDGSTWHLVPAPPSERPTVLNDVSAASSADVWAVGRLGHLGVQDTLTEHWDGSTWQIVPSPSPGLYYSYFNAVDVISATNVWAAGQASGAPSELLVEHSRGCPDPTGLAGDGRSLGVLLPPGGRSTPWRGGST